jgi:hypothetical protein
MNTSAMGRMSVSLFVALTLLSAVTLVARDAGACTCPADDNPVAERKKDVAAADAVFRGRVVRLMVTAQRAGARECVEPRPSREPAGCLRVRTFLDNCDPLSGAKLSLERLDGEHSVVFYTQKTGDVQLCRLPAGEYLLSAQALEKRATRTFSFDGEGTSVGLWVSESPARTVRVVLAVSSWEKGPRTPEVVVETSDDEASCGYSQFTTDGEYEVFATRKKGDGGRYVTSLCSGTKRIGRAKSARAR